MTAIQEQVGTTLRAVPGTPGTLMARWRALRALWRKRREMRFELERLAQTGDWLVADIGLTPEQAAREAEKPFWKP